MRGTNACRTLQDENAMHGRRCWSTYLRWSIVMANALGIDFHCRFQTTQTVCMALKGTNATTRGDNSQVLQTPPESSCSTSQSEFHVGTRGAAKRRRRRHTGRTLGPKKSDLLSCVPMTELQSKMWPIGYHLFFETVMASSSCNPLRTDRDLSHNPY